MLMLTAPDSVRLDQVIWRGVSVCRGMAFNLPTEKRWHEVQTSRKNLEEENHCGIYVTSSVPLPSLVHPAPGAESSHDNRSQLAAGF